MSDYRSTSSPSSCNWICRPALGTNVYMVPDQNCYGARPTFDTTMAPPLRHAGPPVTLDTMAPLQYAKQRTRDAVCSQVHPRQVPKLRPDRKGEKVSTEVLLQIVSGKLKEVEKLRFIMQQKAKIEACHQNDTINYEELEKLQWYDYSGRPQKFTDLSNT